MIISVVFVSMMVVFVTVYYFVAKPKKQQEKIYSAMTTDELIRFVQGMRCLLDRPLVSWGALETAQGLIFISRSENILQTRLLISSTRF
jgi:hypothetical protein